MHIRTSLQDRMPILRLLDRNPHPAFPLISLAILPPLGFLLYHDSCIPLRAFVTSLLHLFHSSRSRVFFFPFSLLGFAYIPE